MAEITLTADQTRALIESESVMKLPPPHEFDSAGNIIITTSDWDDFPIMYGFSPGNRSTAEKPEGAKPFISKEEAAAKLNVRKRRDTGEGGE